MASRVESAVAERDARVADYLDDKLQTIADLSSLDSLLINVRNQQNLLRQQLNDAQRQQQAAKDASNKHEQELRARAVRFEKDQRDIDRRMMVVTGSETSEEAIRKFETSMDRLKRLDVAKGYLEMLQMTESRSQSCMSHLGSDNAKVLDEYRNLRILIRNLVPLQDAADGAAPHLLDHIRSTTFKLEKKIEEAFTASFEKTLKKISWPKPDAPIPTSLQDEFNLGISQLLALQLPTLEEHEKLSELHQTAPLVLLPLAVLIKPLELGFRYHFEGDRTTNRLERPEFFLNHVLDRILSKYSEFVAQYVQPVLEKSLSNTVLALNYAYLDANSAFITALLPMVRNKITSILPQMLRNPALLSHFIHEVIQFDNTLRDEWEYDGGFRTEAWTGLAGEVLSKDDIFSQWLKAERDFALSRYQEIVDAPDSFNLDFDSLGPGKTKPSFAAIRVNDLLEAVTDNYRDLATFSHKLRFLLNIQISLFDLFHSRLAEALAAYLARTSTIGRASKEDQANLQGIAGLERLCRIFGSADYLERAMRDWNDDVFFLDLYTTLYQEARMNPNKPLYEQTTASQIAPLTSSTLTEGHADQPEESTLPPGALFDETAASYARLRDRAEGIISSLLVNAVKASMGRFTRTTHWATLSPSLTPSASNALDANSSHIIPSLGISTTTPELDSVLNTLSSLLGYLAKAVGTVPLRRLTLKVLETLDETFMEMLLEGRSLVDSTSSLPLPGAAVKAAAAASSVVKSSVGSDIGVLLFSLQGARQFRADVQRVGGLVAGIADWGLVESGMGRVREACDLLCVPVENTRESRSFTQDADDDEDGKKAIGLFEAQKRVLGSGQQTKELLEEMGLGRLGVGEARKIVARRVELGSS